MHLDALRVRLVDECLQWIERERRDAWLVCARNRRAVAEAVAAPNGLHDDRVEVRGLRARDDRIDPRRIEQVVAESVDPVRAELAPRRSPGIEVRGLRLLWEPDKCQYGDERQANLPHYLSNDEATTSVAGG